MMRPRTMMFLILTACLFLLMASPARATQTGAGFRVLDIGERTYQGGPAMAVVLSEPLDPKVRHDGHIRISDEERLIKSAWVLSDDHRTLYFPRVKPETLYSVVVLESLQSAGGQTLTKRAIRSVKTRRVTAGVSFASDGLILPKDVARGLPVATVNVLEVDIEFFRLNEKGIDEFVYWRNTTSRRDIWDLKNIKKYGQFVYSGRFELDAPSNRRVMNHIPVMDIEALQAPGLYFTVMRRPGEYDHSFQTSYFLVTDIGLHLHDYHGRALVIASSLKTGKALPGVVLSFYNQKENRVGDGTTDEKGRYLFTRNLAQKKVSFVKAEYGGQLGLLSLDVPALDLSEFDQGGRLQKAREVFLHGPRDLYRPGESVTVSALLRDYDGRPVKNLPFAAALLRPDGRKIRGFTWRPLAEDDGPAGYYQTTIDLPRDSQTGLYRLELRDRPDASPIGVYRFHVEDFMPERMKLDLSSSQDVLTLKDPFKIDVSGMYLYGAPAAGNSMDAKVRVRPVRALFDPFKDFEFGHLAEGRDAESWETDALTLDRDGKTSLVIENRWSKATRPLLVQVAASLYETGGRAVNRSIQRTVWPAPTLIGIRPLFDGGPVDEGPVDFEVIKVDQNGRMMPAANLLLNLTKEERDYYWEYSEDRGWRHQYTETIYTYLTDSLTLDGETPASWRTDLTSGQYVLSIKDPETGLSSSLRFRVGQYWWTGAGRPSARPDKVTLTLDKRRYRPGDTIKLTVTPPHEGEAVIMVEGDKPLWFDRVKVTPQGAVIDIPVPAHWESHDLYISAVVFRPGVAEEKITPNRSVGLVHLPLDRSERKLDLKIDAPDRFVPTDPDPLTVRLTLNQPPPSGQNVFVTLAAVDAGILSITGFDTPDPFAWFFEPRRYNVDYYDLYGKVIELMDGSRAKLKYGGDADMAPGGRPAETKVKLISLFQGPVRFDETGQADVVFDMPQGFNGKVRLMAVAFGDNAFGSAEKEMTVAAPIVTQMALPRFLAPGDKSQLTLDLHNLSGWQQAIELTMTAEGPLVLENGQQTLTLENGRKVSIDFPITALNQPGTGLIRMALKGNEMTLANDWTLGIRPGYPGLARQVRAVVKPGDVFTLDRALTSDLIPETVEADLKISPVIPLNLNRAMANLIAYPYGCLEQTTSRAYPLLYATPANIQRFNLPDIKHEKRIRQLDEAIEHIVLMQRRQGGFGLWNQNSREERWLTAYAVDFLLQARDQGLHVPQTTLDKAFKRLDGYVNRQWPPKNTMDTPAAEDFAVRSYAAYVLAKVGRAPLGALRTTFDHHLKNAGSSLSLAHLGLALNLMGDRERGRQALDAAMTQSRMDYRGDYGSPLRDRTMVLALCLEHDVQAEGLEQLMPALGDALRVRKWFSTQERYAVFKAGLALAQLSGEPVKGLLRIGEKETAVQTKGAYLYSPTLEEIQAGLAFTPQTGGLLYVSAIIGGYTRTPPAKDDSMVDIRRDLYDLKGRKIEKRDFKVGDMFLVHLTLLSDQSIPDALVADLLPAGLELENPNFKHSIKVDDTDLGQLQIDGRAIWRLKGNLPIFHQEYRDDRYVAAINLSGNQRDRHLFYLVRAVSPGRFTVPPPFMESMYRPEIRAVGVAPETIVIGDR